VKTIESEPTTIKSELEQNGFALVNHQIPSDAIDELMDAYRVFTDELPDPSPELLARMLPDPTNLDKIDYSADTGREWHKYRTNHPYQFKPGGYTNRSLATAALRGVRGISIEDDPKEYYHSSGPSLGLMQAHHKAHGWGPIPSEVQRLQRSFTVVDTLANLMIRASLEALEKDYPEIGRIVVTDQDLKTSPIRLLNYHRSESSMLAEGHYDKSILTAQLAESHRGLRIRHPDSRDMQVIDRAPEKAAVFAGNLLTLPHVYPDSAIQPAWHDVESLPVLNQGRHAEGKRNHRYALIKFVNSGYAGEVGKALTHHEV
jgi:isopenicillin N synthase-like dioxygenase